MIRITRLVLGDEGKSGTGLTLTPEYISYILGRILDQLGTMLAKRPEGH